MRIHRLLAVLLALSLTGGALADEGEETADEGEKSAEEVAKELANPNATLAFLTFPLDYVSYTGDLPGADSQSAWRLSFQPSLPYPLAEGTNFFVRPLVPIFLDQPIPESNNGSVGFTGSGVELGDISLDAAVGKTFSNGIVVIGGAVATFPTATDDRLGLDQYLLGPEFLIGKGGSWGFVGLLLTHQWDIAGEDSFDTNVTGGQYFYTVNLKNAWQIQAQPTFSYDHEADSGNRLTLPIGIGVSKTTVIGKTPWKFGVQYWHYLEQSDAFGPDFQIRFVVSPVVPLPW